MDGGRGAKIDHATLEPVCVAGGQSDSNEPWITKGPDSSSTAAMSSDNAHNGRSRCAGLGGLSRCLIFTACRLRKGADATRDWARAGRSASVGAGPSSLGSVRTACTATLLPFSEGHQISCTTSRRKIIVHVCCRALAFEANGHDAVAAICEISYMLRHTLPQRMRGRRGEVGSCWDEGEVGDVVQEAKRRFQARLPPANSRRRDGRYSAPRAVKGAFLPPTPRNGHVRAQVGHAFRSWPLYGADVIAGRLWQVWQLYQVAIGSAGDITHIRAPSRLGAQAHESTNRCSQPGARNILFLPSSSLHPPT